MNSNTVLRYLEIIFISGAMVVGVITASTILSGLVFHGGHSHYYLERSEWSCVEYTKKEGGPVALREQDCILYRRNF